MTLQAVCCFTHLTSTDYVWYDAHYCVKKFVDALKFREVKGSAWIPVGGQGEKRKLEQTNAGDAVEWFGEMAAEILVGAHLQQKPMLVPYPSSKCTQDVAVSKTRRLADAIAHRFEADVSDVLRYQHSQASARAVEGTRDVARVYAELVLIGSIDRDKPYVLVDDILATGSHARAGAAILIRNGAKVVLVVCGARADNEPVKDHFSRVRLELDEYIPAT
jgi:hypothetical protein